MSLKDIFKLLIIIVLFYLIAPFLLRTVFKVFYNSRVQVLYAIPINGYITNYEMNRQYYLYYLDGDKKTRYDFNAFVSSMTSAEVHKTGLTQQELDGPGLGAYLRKGDYVSKAAQSTELTVRRNDTITHWACSPKQYEE